MSHMDAVNSPTRVLQIFSSLDRGGAESRTVDIYRKIDRDKVQFDFLVTTPDIQHQHFTQEIKSLGGKVIEIKSWRKIGLLGYLRQWRELFKENNYPIAHAHLSLDSGIPLFFAWLHGVPKRIAHARSSSVQAQGLKDRLYYAIVRRMTNIFSNIKIYCSEEARLFVFGNKIFSPRRQYFLPNAIDLTLFNEISEQKRESLYQMIGIQNDVHIVGTVGNARYEKNHIFLVKIFHELLAELPQAILLIIGDHAQDIEAKEYVKVNRMESSVFFLGKRDDVPDLLQLFSVFILPSFSEGAPGVVIEAQAANLPCVLSANITRDIDIGTGLLKYLSLEAPLEEWVDLLKESIFKQKTGVEEVHRILRDNGYDSSSSAQKLLDIYEVNI